MVGRFWTSGRDRTRHVMFTICRSFVPVSEAMFLQGASNGSAAAASTGSSSRRRTWASPGRRSLSASAARGSENSGAKSISD